MPDDEEYSLPLKNGGHAKVQQALGERFRLERLLRNHPQHFEMLLALARGQAVALHKGLNAAGRESIKFLRSHGSVLKDGTVRPIIRDVLLSGYQLTPEGPVITQPFVLASEQDKMAVERVDSRLDAALRKWINDAMSQDGDHDRSP